MNVEHCVALHNRLFDIGRAGVGMPSEPAVPQGWFAFHGDRAQAVRHRLSPSLVTFLEQAWACDENDHALFYYASGLAYPESMWTTHQLEAETDSPYRYLTLYTATNISAHPEGIVFDQETNLAIMQMSIHDASIAHNGRQTRYPLEVVLNAWLDMVASGKVQAVPKDVDAPNGKYDPWILHPYSERQVEETVEAFSSLVDAIEARLPPSLEPPASTSRSPFLSDAVMDVAGLPRGFARSFLSLAHQPHFRFIAPGLEVPTSESFPDHPFQAPDGDEDGDGEGVVNVPPVLLFRSAVSFTAPAPAPDGGVGIEHPFSWPYSDTSSYPSGLYLTNTDRESGTEFEDGAKLVLPFVIGARGFARTADGARFGENKDSRDTMVEAKDTFTNVYQPGYIPFGEQHETRLVHVLRAWRKEVESQIFGGVVVFARGENDIGCHNAFIHPTGGRRLLFQLSEDQLQRLHCFLLRVPPAKETSPTSLPVPFYPQRSTRRVDPWDALTELHIFRNRYERTLPAYRVQNCVPTPEDYPEVEDMIKTFRERFI